MTAPTTARLCACGCGQPTGIAKRTRHDLGHVKGEALPRLPGHHGAEGRGRTWRSGRVVLTGGYIGIRMPEHPRAHQGYVREHVLIVEAALGHPLRRTAEVHHVDENTANNANTNLVACHDRAYHKLLHRRARAYAACGDANALPCKICHSYDRQEDLTRFKGRRVVAAHRSCSRERGRAERRSAV